MLLESMGELDPIEESIRDDENQSDNDRDFKEYKR